MTGLVVWNQLAGPPVGAALFAAGRALPFVSESVCVLAGVLLIWRVRLPGHGADHLTANGGHPSVVSFELTAMGEVTRLRLVHSHLTPGGSYLKVVAPGWPMLLSSLKSLVETGEPLEFRASA
jgi:hypothetical protein